MRMDGSEKFNMTERNSKPEWHANGEKDAFINVPASEKDDHSSECKAKERENWDSKLEYILTLLGYSVGFGNVWRFPYICIRNGGGAFLIPFFICLVIAGLPLYFLEVSMAQFYAKSCYHVWDISPMFRGVGVANIFLITVVSWYYAMVLAWVVVFLINSFKSPLPWTICGQPWNTNSCVPLQGLVNHNLSAFDGNDSANDSVSMDAFSISGNDTLLYGNDSFGNKSVLFGPGAHISANVTKRFSSDEFWLNYVLNLSPGMEHIGTLQWHLVVSLLGISVLVFLCVWKGVRSVGKVVYVTATLPYILITVLLIRGSLLTGAADGILFFITPNFSKLGNINTWIEACVQVFYSLGPSWGSLLTMASYNKFNNNCLKDSVALSFVCEGTSIYAGLATMSFLGHMAYKLAVPVETFASSGPGLAFVVYPEAISHLPLPQLWGVVFFLMLLSLGLDSQFAFIEAALTFIADMFPRFTRRWNVFVKAAFQLALFLGALIFCTEGGMYVFQLVDWYIGCFTVLVVAVLQCVVIAWIYGTRRFSRDIELMIGSPPPFIFLVMWKFITPVVLAFVCLFTLAFYTAPTYEGYVYSHGAITFCWCFVMTSFALIPIFAVYSVLSQKGTFMQRLRAACTPTENWLPADKSLHGEYREENKNYRVFEGFSWPLGRLR